MHHNPNTKINILDDWTSTRKCIGYYTKCWYFEADNRGAGYFMCTWFFMETHISPTSGARSLFTTHNPYISLAGMLSTDHSSGDPPSSSPSSSTSQPLGEVIISKESTLEDLKQQVMTLPQMGQVSVPTSRFLRLRLIENRLPTLVLRNHSQTLQYVLSIIIDVTFYVAIYVPWSRYSDK